MTQAGNARIVFYRQLQKVSEKVRMLELPGGPIKGAAPDAPVGHRADPAAVAERMAAARQDEADAAAAVPGLAARVRYLDHLTRGPCSISCPRPVCLRSL
jgi:hypothetical protein